MSNTSRIFNQRMKEIHIFNLNPDVVCMMYCQENKLYITEQQFVVQNHRTVISETTGASKLFKGSKCGFLKLPFTKKLHLCQKKCVLQNFEKGLTAKRTSSFRYSLPYLKIFLIHTKLHLLEIVLMLIKLVYSKNKRSYTYFKKIIILLFLHHLI